MMNKSASAFNNNNSFLIDLIDTFKGTGHCEREWVKYQLKTKDHKSVKDELTAKKYWR